MDSKTLSTPTAGRMPPPSQLRMRIHNLLQARLQQHFTIATGQALKRSYIQEILTESFLNEPDPSGRVSYEEILKSLESRCLGYAVSAAFGTQVAYSHGNYKNIKHNNHKSSSATFLAIPMATPLAFPSAIPLATYLATPMAASLTSSLATPLTAPLATPLATLLETPPMDSLNASLVKQPVKKVQDDEPRTPSHIRMKIQSLLQVRLRRHFEVATGQSLKRSSIQEVLHASFLNKPDTSGQITNEEILRALDSRSLGYAITSSFGKKITYNHGIYKNIRELESPIETPLATPIETPLATPTETPVATTLETLLATSLATSLEKGNHDDSRTASHIRMKIQSLLQARLREHFEVAIGRTLKRSYIQNILAASFANKPDDSKQVFNEEIFKALDSRSLGYAMSLAFGKQITYNHGLYKNIQDRNGSSVSSLATPLAMTTPLTTSTIIPIKEDVTTTRDVCLPSIMGAEETKPCAKSETSINGFGNENYTCDFCAESFPAPTEFYEHLRSHNDNEHVVNIQPKPELSDDLTDVKVKSEPVDCNESKQSETRQTILPLPTDDNGNTIGVKELKTEEDETPSPSLMVDNGDVAAQNGSIIPKPLPIVYIHQSKNLHPPNKLLVCPETGNVLVPLSVVPKPPIAPEVPIVPIAPEAPKIQCTLCIKKFGTKDRLDKHMITHTKRHVCSVCGKRFDQKGNLNQHLRTHTGERPFVCSICGKNYRQLGALLTHKIYHRDKRPFECSTCKKGCVTKAELVIHNRIHTGERPDLCSICGKRFIQKSALNRHMRTHDEEPRFKCSLCGKRFYKKEGLTRHLKTHRSSDS